MGWLRRLFSRERLEADLDKELRFHFESQVADKVRSGIPESEARRLTRIEFGGIEQIKEDCRERRGTMWLESLLQDVRYALRQLRKAPGFTLTAVLTLALGIGATTAIFTLVQQVMLQSLPVTRPDQLWRIGDQPHCCNWAGYSQDSDGEPGDWSLFPWEAYKLFRANTPGFQDLAALQAGSMPLAVRRAGSSGPPDTANGQYVSGNFFQTLGVSAWRGRLLVDADDREGAPPVAVMSFHAWQEKYGSDPSVVGSTYQINGRAFTIIGVAPAGFVGAKMVSWGMPDIWMPLTTEPLMLGTTARIKNTRVDWLDLIGRVRPGTNPKALQAQLQSELHGWLASHLADMSPQEKAVWQKQTLRLSPGGAGFSDFAQGLQRGSAAAHGHGLLCAAGGLRQHRQPAAGPRAEEPAADGSPRGAGRIARTPGEECAARKRYAVSDRRRGRCGCGLGGGPVDPLSRFPHAGAKHLDSGAGYALNTGSAFRAGSLGAHRRDLRDRARVDDLARRAGGGAAWRQP